jgi:hypothetical protein
LEIKTKKVIQTDEAERERERERERGMSESKRERGQIAPIMIE